MVGSLNPDPAHRPGPCGDLEIDLFWVTAQNSLHHRESAVRARVCLCVGVGVSGCVPVYAHMCLDACMCVCVCVCVCVFVCVCVWDMIGHVKMESQIRGASPSI